MTRLTGAAAASFLSAHGCRWGVPREMRWLCRGAIVVDYWTGFGGWYRTVTPPANPERVVLNIGSSS